MTEVDLKIQLLYPYHIERKKITKHCVRIFMRMINATVRHSMIIGKPKSTGTKSDHLNLRMDLMQALLMEHGSGMGGKSSRGTFC
jgi:hypothetical protein